MEKGELYIKEPKIFEEQLTLIRGKGFGYGYFADRKLFSQLLMLKFLYPNKNRWNSKFTPALKALIEEYEKDISLKHIGFPGDWEERVADYK